MGGMWYEDVLRQNLSRYRKTWMREGWGGVRLAGELGAGEANGWKGKKKENSQEGELFPLL